MTGRFPLYTDADVHGPLIAALRAHGWEVVRAIDLYPQETTDIVHFERASKENRVLISNDRGPRMNDMPASVDDWRRLHRRSPRRAP